MELAKTELGIVYVYRQSSQGKIKGGLYASLYKPELNCGIWGWVAYQGYTMNLTTE